MMKNKQIETLIAFYNIVSGKLKSLSDNPIYFKLHNEYSIYFYRDLHECLRTEIHYDRKIKHIRDAYYNLPECLIFELYNEPTNTFQTSYAYSIDPYHAFERLINSINLHIPENEYTRESLTLQLQEWIIEIV